MSSSTWNSSSRGYCSSTLAKRLAGVAVRGEAGALLDRRDLAPHIGNAVRIARIGGRGEQTDDAMLADQIAGGVEIS